MADSCLYQIFFLCLELFMKFIKPSFIAAAALGFLTACQAPPMQMGDLAAKTVATGSAAGGTTATSSHQKAPASKTDFGGFGALFGTAGAGGLGAYTNTPKVKSSQLLSWTLTTAWSSRCDSTTRKK